MRKRKSLKTNVYIRLLFFVIPLFLISYITSSYFLLRLADTLVLSNQLQKAEIFYRLSKIVNPLNPAINKRLLAIELLRSEKGTSEESEESVSSSSATVVAKNVVVPVLMYHYIRVNPYPTDKVGFNLSVTPYTFELQMKYLVDHGYQSITLGDLEAAMYEQKTLPQKPIVITFDDGYRDAYTEAFPILKKLGLRGTVFVITGVVNTPRYLSWEQMHEMEQSGVFSFAVHTVHHYALTALPDNQIRTELIGCRKAFEKHDIHYANWLAYPYGGVNDRVVTIVRELGFVGAFGTNKGTFESPDQIFTLPRVRVGGTDTVGSLAKKLPW